MTTIPAPANRGISGITSQVTSGDFRIRDSSALDQLTLQEQHIADWSSRPTSPRDCPQSRAIDYHLHEVFTELQIASRIELARRVFPSARRTEQQDR